MPGGEEGPAPGEVLVSELKASGEALYEQFLARHPYALIYYSLRFRDLVLDLLSCQERYAVAWVGGEIAGVLPLMVADGPYGRILNSLPFFGSNGGILAADDQAAAALLRWYDSQVCAPDVAAGTVIANPIDSAPLEVTHNMGDARVGMVTTFQPLENHEDRPRAERYVLELISGSARRNVNKALRSGVTVAVDNHAFSDLEKLHVANMGAIGGRTKSPSFFHAIPQHLRADHDFNLYVGRIGDRVAAALLVLYYGSTVEYYVPAIDAEYRTLQPLAAILSTAMAESIARGFLRWNWGGSWLTQENLVRFKSKWGGQPHNYEYWTQVNDPTLLKEDSATLLGAYPGFYVAPFKQPSAPPTHEGNT